MDGSHQTFFNSKIIIDNLCQRSQTVGCTRCITKYKIVITCIQSLYVTPTSPKYKIPVSSMSQYVDLTQLEHYTFSMNDRPKHSMEHV